MAATARIGVAVRNSKVKGIDAKEAEASLRGRKRAGGDVPRGRRASKSRNAQGRTGGRNTGRRTSRAEMGSRRGVRATATRLRRRSGGHKGDQSTGLVRTLNRPNSRTLREDKAGVARKRNPRKRRGPGARARAARSGAR
jgi:hypothetical protein